jgi:outer membrane protein
MIYRFRIVFFVVGLLSSLRVAGVTQPALTLDECYNRADKYSVRLRQTDNSIRRAELLRSEIVANGKPAVKLEAGASYAPMSSDFGYDPAASNGGQLNGQIVVEQSLYDGGVRTLKIRQMKLELDRLSGIRRSILRDLRFDVRLAFVEMLRSQQEVELRRESVSRLTEYFDLVTRLTHGGSAGYTDLLKTRVELTNDSLALQKAAESLSAAAFVLADLIGAPADTSFAVAGSLDSLGGDPADSVRVGNSLDTLANLDTYIADLNTRSSQYDLELTRREQRPLVSAFADAGLLTTGENLRLPAAERSSMIGYSAGVSVQMPLFGWGVSGLRLKQQALVSDSLRLETAGLRRTLALGFRRARMRMAGAARRLQSIRANIKLAEENFLLTRAKYVSGNTLSLEVLDAQQLLSDAKLTELEALAELQSLAAELEKITTQ